MPTVPDENEGSETALEVAELLSDDGPDRLESDGTNSTSGGASTNTEGHNQNSSGYNSNDNHASAENLNPLSRSFSISKLKRPAPNDYLELDLDGDTQWRNSSGSFSNFIPAQLYPNSRAQQLVPRTAPLETMAEVDPSYYSHMEPGHHMVLSHNRQSSYMQDSTARSQYTYHPPHHTHHRKKKEPSCSSSGWRGTFIGLVITAMILLFTVVCLGVWKYVQVPQNVDMSKQDDLVERRPTNEPIQCTSNVKTDLLFDLRNELQLNQEKRLILEAGATYPLIFSVESDQTISIYFTLSSTCRLVLIGRREGIPKLSDHHFLDTIVGPFTIENGREVTKTTRHLNSGRWYVSLVNDGEYSCEFSVAVGSLTTNCPNGCSGNGHCNSDSSCSCFDGWSGLDCSVGSCQATCSGNGQWVKDKCHCYNGWKGAWCNTRIDECEVECKNGKCSGGKCECEPNYTGEKCDTLVCQGNCSSNGVCINGRCRCYQGFSGADCSLTVGDTCNFNGLLLNNTCHCYQGFGGSYCDIEESTQSDEIELDSPCDPPCRNGGSCYHSADEWRCRCPRGFVGFDCSIKSEYTCDDGLDNDSDGLTDCLDPDCCSATACRNTKYCVSSPAIKQPQKTESFQLKIRSLISELQSTTSGSRNLNFAKPVSLVVGELIDVNDQPLQGVRITSLSAFTHSRSDGTFHIVVESNLCTSLSFQRDGFRSYSQVVCPARDYHELAPIQLRLVWDYQSQRQLARRAPPPPLVSFHSNYPAHFMTPKQDLVDSPTQKVNFLADIMDGSTSLRLVSPYPDQSLITLTVSDVKATHLIISVYCQGQQVLKRRKSGHTGDLVIHAKWNQEDFFTEVAQGKAYCTGFVGAKYTVEDDYVWTRKTVPVLARAPAQLTKSTLGHFRFGFDSIFEPKSGLVYHMSSQRIESVNFNYEKVNKSSITINNLINHYELEDYSVSVTRNGVYKTFKGRESQKELISNVRILGESLHKNKLYFVTRTGLHELDHLREFTSILVKSESYNGPITVSKSGEIFLTSVSSDLILVRDKKPRIISSPDPNSFRIEPCFGRYQKLMTVDLEQARFMSYNHLENALIIYIYPKKLLKIDLQTEDFWTTLLAGEGRSCPSERDNSAMELWNNIQVSPTGDVLASSIDQIFEIGENGDIVPVFGSCGSNCEMIPSNSPARLNSVVNFSFKRSGVIQLIERFENSNVISVLKPIKPRRTSSGFEIGYPKENILRVFLTDGRLVQIKDIFTMKTIKFLKYQSDRLISVRDQFNNEIKASHAKGRILLQNSANQRRAQITLNDENLPIELRDDDIQVKFEFDSKQQVTQINNIQYQYTDGLLTSSSINNNTVFINRNPLSKAFWSSSINNCSTLTWNMGQFYKSEQNESSTKSITSDGSTVTNYVEKAYDTIITSLDPISKRPHHYGSIINRGTALVPVKETSWISIAQDKEYVKRMLKDGSTLMSYDLDYSSDAEVQGRFYDERVNLLGQLSFDKDNARIRSSRVQYQKLHSSSHINQKKYTYSDSGLITKVEGDSKIDFSRSRSGRLSSIIFNGNQAWKMKVSQRSIDIRTPENDLYQLNFDWSNPASNSRSMELTYPSGTKFLIEENRENDFMTKTYKRNGIVFLSVEETSAYYRQTRLEENRSENTVQLKRCDGQPINDGHDQTFVYENGQLTGVNYRNGPRFKTSYAVKLRTLDQAQDYDVSYRYDSAHRPLITQMTVFGQSVQRKWQYDDSKDELKQVDDFRVSYFGDSLYDMTDGRARLIRKYQAEDQTKLVKRNSVGQLVIDGSHVYEFNFQENSEVFQIAIQNSKREMRLKSTFDQSGRIKETLSERMSYSTGILRSITRSNQEIIINRDHFDRIVKFGSLRLVYSGTNGGLDSIGGDALTWSSQDQLTSYNGVSLFYDHESRLIQFGDQKFVYADTLNPNKITHSFSEKKHQAFYYDHSGALIMILKNSPTSEKRLLHVMSSKDGTPLKIFDDSGSLVQEFYRSYFGQLIEKPSVDLIIGHRGDFCIGYMCRSNETKNWRQVLTGDRVFFGEERSILDRLINIQPDLAFDPMRSVKWPYRNSEHFSLLFSKREKLIETFLSTVLRPALPQLTC